MAFVSLGQTVRFWFGISIDSLNHDVFATDNGSGLYKQTAGIGNFVFQSNNLDGSGWHWVAVNSTTKDLYATFGDQFVYKQTASSGNFNVIFDGGSSDFTFEGICVDSFNNDVFVCDSHATGGGDIYKQTGGAGSFVALGETAREWLGIAVNSTTKDLYATTNSQLGTGDIYKKTGGVGSFISLGQADIDWAGISIDSYNNDVYATVGGAVGLGDIYKQSNGIGNFIALGETSRNWLGISIDNSNDNVYVVVDNGNIYEQVASPRPTNEYIQTIQMVGAEIGDVQTLNAGKSDDSTPINYELETQDLDFGNRSHLHKLGDKIVVFTKDAGESQLAVKEDGGNYQSIPVSLTDRVNIEQNFNAEGHFLNLKWSGNSSTVSPILEGMLFTDIFDMGNTNK